MPATVLVLAVWTLSVILVLMFLAGAQIASGEGELELPEGFQPGSVNLVATASSPRKAEVRVQFPWQLQERFTHVGK